MSDDLHRITDDLRDIRGRPSWMWRHVGRGLQRAEQFLAAHAEFQSRHPEDADEAHD